MDGKCTVHKTSVYQARHKTIHQQLSVYIQPECRVYITTMQHILMIYHTVATNNFARLYSKELDPTAAFADSQFPNDPHSNHCPGYYSKRYGHQPSEKKIKKKKHAFVSRANRQTLIHSCTHSPLSHPLTPTHLLTLTHSLTSKQANRHSNTHIALTRLSLSACKHGLCGRNVVVVRPGQRSRGPYRIREEFDRERRARPTRTDRQTPTHTVHPYRHTYIQTYKFKQIVPAHLYL